VTPRSMFGGVGLYHRGVFFGIIARGMKPFKPYRDRPGTMQYYAVPLAVLESAMDLTTWARKAVAAAERGAPRR